MNEKTRELILKRILPLAVIALYVIGMVLMIFGNFGNGVTLWVISTAGGALLLYVKRRREKIAADEAQAEGTGDEVKCECAERHGRNRCWIPVPTS